jgi:hypothetical protein
MTLALPKTTSLWEVYPPKPELQAILARYVAGSGHVRDISRSNFGFQFGIKIYNVNIPDWARSHVSDLDEVINESFNNSLEMFSDYLKGTYDWIDEVGTAGRSGGWLMVIPKDGGSLADFIDHGELDPEEGEEEEFDLGFIARIAHDVVDIDTLVEHGKRQLSQLLGQLRTWKKYVQGDGIIPAVEPDPKVVTASETYFDSTPPQEMEPEDRTFVNPMDDKKLRRTNPKRYDPRADWYTGNNMEGHDSPVENRYDDAPSLTAGLKASTIVRNDILDLIAPLDWEINSTIDAGKISVVASIGGESFMAKLVARSNLWEALKKVSTQEMTYAEFPSIVRYFIEKYFEDVFKKYPEVKDIVKGMRVEFTPRPTHAEGMPGVPMPTSTGAEYFVGDNVIRYYLPPETIEQHWRGIVHEIVHVIQGHLKGQDPGIPPAPDDTKPEYYTDHAVYRKDPGEQHAYKVQDEFVQFLNDHKE